MIRRILNFNSPVKIVISGLIALVMFLSSYLYINFQTPQYEVYTLVSEKNTSEKGLSAVSSLSAFGLDIKSSASAGVENIFTKIKSKNFSAFLIETEKSNLFGFNGERKLSFSDSLSRNLLPNTYEELYSEFLSKKIKLKTEVNSNISKIYLYTSNPERDIEDLDVIFNSLKVYDTNQKVMQQAAEIQNVNSAIESGKYTVEVKNSLISRNIRSISDAAIDQSTGEFSVNTIVEPQKTTLPVFPNNSLVIITFQFLGLVLIILLFHRELLRFYDDILTKD